MSFLTSCPLIFAVRQYWRSSNDSANPAIAIFRAMYLGGGGVGKPSDEAVSGEWDVIGGAEERGAIKLERARGWGKEVLKETSRNHIMVFSFSTTWSLPLDSIPLLCSSDHILHSSPATYCLIRSRLPKLSQNIFTLKMATAIFAETLENDQHSTWLIPEGQSFLLSSWVFMLQLFYCYYFHCHHNKVPLLHYLWQCYLGWAYNCNILNQ